MELNHAVELFIHEYPYHVLIVDDDDTHRQLQKEILQAPKYQVHEACSGAEALEKLKQTNFDVVLMDIRMADMNGLEATYRIRKEHNHQFLPIIMVTASQSDEELQESFSVGARDFIRKPYSPLDLDVRVDSAAKQKRLMDQYENAESILFALARMVEAKDGHTGEHCTRLQHMAGVFSEKLGLSAADRIVLEQSGVLHDIGKLGIPDAILLKPTKLTKDEWEVMRQHTVIGEQLCSGLNKLKLTLPIIRHHHERYDGSGYPDGLKGKDIPYLARVFQVLDIYDALQNKRSYKEAFSQQKVIDILLDEKARGWRDPEIIDSFIELIREQGESLALPVDHPYNRPRENRQTELNKCKELG